MLFQCPRCKFSSSLEITSSMALPPDRYAREVMLQVVQCKECNFSGLAIYEEARGSVVESETWRHTGYWVSPDAIRLVSLAIRECPNPLDSYCQCDSHISFGQKDSRNAWRGLIELYRSHTFMMRISNS